jgi:hypothetical protein
MKWNIAVLFRSLIFLSYSKASIVNEIFEIRNQILLCSQATQTQISRIHNYKVHSGQINEIKANIICNTK